jgi:type II secretion system protein J
MRFGFPHRFRGSKIGFTILELMISIGIFALILTAVYSIWVAILKGTRAGQKAAAEVQRARVALRTLEDAFNSTEFFQANMKYYYFYADTSGDFASVSLVARLPDGFLGSEQYQQLQQKVRRVTFEVAPGKDGMHDLMLTQAPILLPETPANSGYAPYTTTLAKDVTFFQLLFFDPLKGEWLQEWTKTNQLPKIVQIALGLGRSANNSGKSSEVVYSLVSLPSDTTLATWQGGLQGQPPGTVPPGTVPPGTVPPGGYPPGTGPPSGTPPGGFPPRFR